jgi:hydroxysqualene dehydroxylase
VTDGPVVIIGAGLAGLSAATLLAQSGVTVIVLDARAQLGGRATAFVDRETGELVDNGQHVLFGCYHATFEFLRRIGAMENVRVQPSLAIPYVDRDGRRSVLRCPALPSPLHLLAGILDWDAMAWRDRLSALHLTGPLRRARRELKRTGNVTADPPGTVAEWLNAHNQRRKLRTWLWEPLAIAALNQAPEVAAASPFVRVLAEMFGPDPTAAALVLPTRPLHEMYAEPARRFLEAHGATVRLNALARLVLDGERVGGVEVRGERIDARAVLSTVPWFDVKRLFSGEPPPPIASIVTAAGAMESMPIVTVNLWYDRRVMDDAFVGLPGRQMHWVFDKRVAFGEETSHLSLISSAAVRLARLGNEDLVAIADREMRESLPGARAARLARATVVREKQATFSLAPGQPPRPGVLTALPGLYLAGDWIDTGLPGTIESAVISGHRAALAIVHRAAG